jgi:hypothetical protein
VCHFFNDSKSAVLKADSLVLDELHKHFMFINVTILNTQAATFK